MEPVKEMIDDLSAICQKVQPLGRRLKHRQQKLINRLTCNAIKTHGHVSAAKKDVRHTSVLYTGTAKSPFSTPHICIITGPISSYIFYALLSQCMGGSKEKLGL